MVHIPISLGATTTVPGTDNSIHTTVWIVTEILPNWKTESWDSKLGAKKKPYPEGQDYQEHFNHQQTVRNNITYSIAPIKGGGQLNFT